MDNHRADDRRKIVDIGELALRKITWLFVGATLVLLGCKLPFSIELNTATPIPSSTLQPSNTPVPTLDTAATGNAQETREAQVTRDAQGTSDAGQSTRTAAVQNESATKAAGERGTEIASVRATATAFYNSFLDEIRRLSDEGVIDSVEGDLYKIDDFDESLAKLNYFDTFKTGYSGENFVFEADLSWEVASMGSDWETSGCGLIYGREDGENYGFTFLGLDGNVSSLHWASGEQIWLSQKRWGRPDLPKGKAHFLLSVWNKRIRVFVNDSPASSFIDTRYGPGEIALTLVSGTNKDFGTRCQMSNIKLFIFK